MAKDCRSGLGTQASIATVMVEPHMWVLDSARMVLPSLHVVPNAGKPVAV